MGHGRAFNSVRSLHQERQKIGRIQDHAAPETERGASVLPGGWCGHFDAYRKEEDGWYNNYNMNGCNLSATAFPDDVIFPLLKTDFEGVEVYVP